MKQLIIIGARGAGREAYGGAKQMPAYNKEWVVKGFLDDKKDLLDGFNLDIPILDTVENYKVQKEDIFVCPLGSVAAKKKYMSIILDKGGVFPTFIHPTAVIQHHVKLGTGVNIGPNVVITCDVTIGDYVTIQSAAILGHDAKIGKWGHIAGFAFMGGYAELEDEVTLHTRSSVLPHVKIGHNSVVGVGSVVMKNVAPNTSVFGNPAKIIF